MTPIDAFNDAIWQAHNGGDRKTYTFRNREYAVSLVRMLESTWRVKLEDHTGKVVNVKFNRR
jgi:hypothetical protein